MQKNRYWRWIALALTLFALLSVIFIAEKIESSTCMGIRVMPAEELAQYKEKEDIDYSDSILLNGEKAPVDKSTNTVYVSQNIDEGMGFSELYGTLGIALNDHNLYFEYCEELDNLKKAVADGKRFRLLVVGPDNQYAEYSVIFTTLPVISLDGEYSHMNLSDREVNRGSVSLWTGYDPDSGRYSVKSSDTEWNVRGATSALLPKKPLKLSLKTKKGNNNDVSFLGMGEDDDWILNPMNTDDTDVREMLAMNLWTGMSEDNKSTTKMSCGEYVEAVINGKYSGVYMLQRRIDKKYLELEKDEILFKGRHTWQAEAPRDGYEITYSSLPEDSTFALLESINAKGSPTHIDLESFIDTSLFIQLGAMHDNKGFNNMFYLLRPEGDGYSLSFIPWDTDLSFGVAYYDWFVYDYESKLQNFCERKEYSLMKETYPDLDRSLASRWFELRGTVFSEENIYSMIDEHTAILKDSGAQAREYAVWGKFHNGADSAETLKNFIYEKIAILDYYYGSFLESAE